MLLLFGAKRLPEMGRNLGRSMREFKSSVGGEDDHPTPGATAEAAPQLIADGHTPAAVAPRIGGTVHGDAGARTPDAPVH